LISAKNRADLSSISAEQSGPVFWPTLYIVRLFLVVHVSLSGDIKVRFYDNDKQWHDYGAFTDDDVHHTVSRYYIQFCFSKRSLK